jgi:hypothetical protein
MRFIAFILCTQMASSLLGGWTPEKWFDAPKSDRAVHYDIKGVLNWSEKKFEGQMRLTWRNTGMSPTRDLPFHLDMNAFRNPDRLSSQQRQLGKQNRPANKVTNAGYCEIKSVTSNGGNLLVSMGEDDTVCWVALPRVVKPSESVQVEIVWEVKFPEIQTGTGWTGYYLIASGWYPKLGYFAGNQWLCAPYSADITPPSYFGNYEVELSLPNALQLANTGTVVTPLDDAGKPLTDQHGRIVEAAYDPNRKLNFLYKIHAEDVQDFSWAVSPQGSWSLERFDFRDTMVFFYYIPKNGSQFERMKEATKSALRYAEKRYGLYPYPVLSIVDLPPEAKGACSAPTLAVFSNVVFDPIHWRAVPEQAVIQQLGEQFFKWGIGLEASDSNALGNSLSSWFVGKALGRAYPTGLITSKRFVMSPDFSGWYANWSGTMCNIPFHSCFNCCSLFANDHRLASTVALSQMEADLGGAVVEKIIRAFVTEYSFKQAGSIDFRRVAERVSSRSVDSLWRNHVENSNTMDYRIKSVDRTAQGHGAITVERIGDIIAPITLWLRLENGQEHRQSWDGEDEVFTFSFDSQIVAAILDPDWNHPSLKSRMHSTYSEKPTRRGLHYWAQNVFGVIGGLLQGIGLG